MEQHHQFKNEINSFRVMVEDCRRSQTLDMKNFQHLIESVCKMMLMPQFNLAHDNYSSIQPRVLSHEINFKKMSRSYMKDIIFSLSKNIDLVDENVRQRQLTGSNTFFESFLKFLTVDHSRIDIQEKFKEMKENVGKPDLDLNDWILSILFRYSRFMTTNFETGSNILNNLTKILDGDKYDFLTIFECQLNYIGLLNNEDRIEKCDYHYRVYFDEKSYVTLSYNNTKEKVKFINELKLVCFLFQLCNMTNLLSLFYDRIKYSSFIDRDNKWTTSREEDCRKIITFFRTNKSKFLNSILLGLKLCDQYIEFNQ